MLKGIDISVWQEPSKINYDKIAKQIDFAILRVGFTGHGVGKTKHKDRHFDRHHAELTKRGIPVGVYWYSCASTPAEAREEARLTLEFIKGKKIEYPVYWDTEDNYHQRPLSKEALTSVAQAYCEAIEKAGYFVGIYASLSWLHNELNMAKLPYSVWVAQWGVSAHSYKGAGMWQYTSDGRLDGYNGRLDMNIAYVDFKKVIAEAGLNHLGGSTPTPTPKPDPKPTPTLLFKKGDKVVVNGQVFSTSAGAGAGVVLKNQTLTVDFNVSEATNGRIKDAKYPIHVGGKGWVKQSDCKKVGTSTTPKPQGNGAGAEVKLNNEPLYATSTTTKVSARITGAYFYWDNKTLNGRRRITNRKDRVGVKGQVTGFIKA